MLFQHICCLNLLILLAIAAYMLLSIGVIIPYYGLWYTGMCSLDGDQISCTKSRYKMVTVLVNQIHHIINDNDNDYANILFLIFKKNPPHAVVWKCYYTSVMYKPGLYKPCGLTYFFKVRFHILNFLCIFILLHLWITFTPFLCVMFILGHACHAYNKERH